MQWETFFYQPKASRWHKFICFLNRRRRPLCVGDLPKYPLTSVGGHFISPIGEGPRAKLYTPEGAKNTILANRFVIVTRKGVYAASS